MEDESDEALFANYKKKTERMMKITVALLAVVFLYVLYTLVTTG